MDAAIPLLVALPLAASGLSIVLWRRVRVQQALGVGTVATSLGLAVGLLLHVESRGIVAVDIGGWPAPIGITLVADLLSMMLLCVSLATVLAVLVYAIGQPRTDKSAFYFHPLYLVLTAGVSASFLTGDLFNLFVSFEVMLSASYVLITLGGAQQQVRSGMTYVVINLLASTLLITVIGLTYAATGTVNMADLVGRLDGIPDGVRAALGALLLVTFGIKAAIFPLFFWLPDAYPTAPMAVTAVFAGLLTKVGVYAIIRTQTLLFGPDGFLEPLLLVVAVLTMVVGVLGAIAQDDMKRILSFHIVSQVGYMIFGLALFSVGGLAATTLFMVHHIPVKTSLFLVTGVVEQVTGSGALRQLGGLIRRTPLLAALFLVPALSLAGLPPFSGFVGKLALAQAGLAAEQWLATGVSLVVSALTLYSMTKIWAGVFWGTPEEAPLLPSAAGEARLRPPALMVGATCGLVSLTLGIALFAQPLYQLSERAAVDLLDRSAYVTTVLDR